MGYVNKFVLDSRETNKVFMEYMDEENWEYKRLTLSDYIILNEDQEDLDCGDMSNQERDGIVEFKSFGDMVGSTTGDGVYHLQEQVTKMFATGLPNAVVIYGSRYIFQKKATVGNELILAAIQKLTSIATVFDTKIIPYAYSEQEAIEAAKTFLRKAPEMPRRMPIYNLFKNREDTPVAMLCGIPKVGPVVANAILDHYGSLYAFYKEVEEAIEDHGFEKMLKVISKPVIGVGPEKTRMMVKAWQYERKKEE